MQKIVEHQIHRKKLTGKNKELVFIKFRCNDLLLDKKDNNIHNSSKDT
jgi:hypothetical protein